MFVDEIFTFENADIVFGVVVVALYAAVLIVQRSFNKKI